MPQRKRAAESGFTLFTVVVFIFLVLLSGFAFFTVATYETRGAMYRQNSSESFYLADGAVERARARFLADRAWRDGWAGEPSGRGHYSLSVTDTTYQGEEAVYLVADGQVAGAHRRIGVFADVPPTGFDLTLLVMGDADIKGNMCMEGTAHVNGDGDFGAGDVHLQCGGSYTEGFEIVPPPIFTEPDKYPGATYYYVEGARTGTVTHAKIYDANQADITAALGDSLQEITTWNAGQKTYTFEFKNDEVQHYFDDSTGVFQRAPGDSAVVVNFGEVLANPPDVMSWVILNDDTPIQATIINTRFTAVADSERVKASSWFGGPIEFKKATVEPKYGIAFIAKDTFTQPGASNLTIGTANRPALVYVTGDFDFGTANWVLTGSLIVLGDLTSVGGPTIIYDDGFLDNIPQYLFDEWPFGVSGSLKVLAWRELAVGL